MVLIYSRPEPIMLKILPTILSRISFPKFSPIILSLILVSSLLFHNNAQLVSVASPPELINSHI